MDRAGVARRLDRERAARRLAEQEGRVEAWVTLRARERHLAALLEGWDERLHPRGRGGKWRRKAATTLGSTAYLKRRAFTRGVAAPETHATARRLHDDPAFRPLFHAFERDARALAKKHGVDIELHPNVGVYEGAYEPSYAITARGNMKDIRAFNVALGREFDQKEVVGFTPDPDGADAEVRLRGGGDPDAFYRRVVDVMGMENAGVSYDEDGTWRVFVMGEDPETMGKLMDAAEELGMSVEAVRGQGIYDALRGGEG